jgi:uncharacterized protein (TIGR01777 family)
MQSADGRYLLSGASGMLGLAIKRAMGARQLQTLQLVRPARDQHGKHKDAPVPADRLPAASRVFRAVAISITGEVLWDPAATPVITHPEILEGLPAAIHLGGVSVASRRWTPEFKREILASRVDSTRALARTLAGLKDPPKTLLVASGVGFYGNRGDELLDESSSSGSGFLADLCRQWEEAAEPARRAGIRVVHLRMGIVLGSPDHPSSILNRLRGIFRCGLGGQLGPGTQWMSWISLDDVVSAIFFLLDRPDIAGPVNLTAPNPVTNAQFARALARQLHRPAFFPVPASLLRSLTGEFADEALLSSARAFPSKLTTAGFQFAHPTIDLALASAFAKR